MPDLKFIVYHVYILSISVTSNSIGSSRLELIYFLLIQSRLTFENNSNRNDRDIDKTRTDKTGRQTERDGIRS